MRLMRGPNVTRGRNFNTRRRESYLPYLLLSSIYPARHYREDDDDDDTTRRRVQRRRSIIARSSTIFSAGDRRYSRPHRRQVLLAMRAPMRARNNKRYFAKMHSQRARKHGCAMSRDIRSAVEGKLAL